MRLSEFADKYVRENGLRATAISTNCRRFERLTGLSDPAQISLPVIVGFRQAAMALALSPNTIEKTVTDVMTTVKFACGAIPDVGKRLKQKKPKPRPAEFDKIEAVFAAAESERLRRWLALTFWTGLRLSDSVTLYATCKAECEVLRLSASKTDLDHCWPVPAWLRPWLRQVEVNPGYSTGWFGKLIRDELSETCERAGVKRFTPKHIRQASINAWTEANATAGAIIHGQGLGVMAHYLAPLNVLRSAAPRVRVPSCFGGTNAKQPEEALVASFRLLDEQAKGLVVMTAERLAAG